MSRLSILTLLLAFLLVTPGLVIHAQNRPDPNSLGTVNPLYVYEPTVIAIPTIERHPGTPAEVDTFARIIRRDLQLTGFFKMPANEQMVNQLYAQDNRQGSLNFEAWRGIGAVHLLLARVVPDEGGRLAAEVMLHDVESGTAIMQRRISGPADQVRQLAHKISDEVVRFTKNVDGFAQTRILFTTQQVPEIREAALMDADAFNQRAITRYGKMVASPVWGQNGTEVFYTSYHGNLAIIYGHILATDQTWRVAAYGGTNHSAAWSDAAQRMVMVLSRDGNSEVYTSGRDGSGLTRLTNTPRVTEGSPTWSPDGRRIAYVSDESGSAQLWVMNADGSGRRRLTSRGTWNDAPSWSPDGRRIAFVSREGGVSDIYTVSADGAAGSYKRLTKGQGQNESPTWAPNSTHLAFSSNRTGNFQIYLMLDDGSNQVQLTNTGRNRQPAWGPMPAQ
jgi:TolB protein